MILPREAVMTGPGTAPSLLLRPREATYCPRHFLVAAAAYYALVADASRDSLAEARRLRAREVAKKKKRAATPTAPTRVQPGRRVKAVNLCPAKNETLAATRSAGAERKIEKLMNGVGIPLREDGEMMGMGEWKGEILRRIRCEMARHAELRWQEEEKDFQRKGGKECVFGSRPWVCEGCVEEVAMFWKLRNPPSSAEMKDSQKALDARMQPEAEMPGPVEVEVEKVQCDGDWGTVEVPTEDVVSVGGLRFVVDVCGGMMTMFV